MFKNALFILSLVSAAAHAESTKNAATPAQQISMPRALNAREAKELAISEFLAEVSHRKTPMGDALKELQSELAEGAADEEAVIVHFPNKIERKHIQVSLVSSSYTVAIKNSKSTEAVQEDSAKTTEDNIEDSDKLKTYNFLVLVPMAGYTLEKPSEGLDGEVAAGMISFAANCKVLSTAQLSTVDCEEVELSDFDL
jgi:hypothetical protein